MVGRQTGLLLLLPALTWLSGCAGRITDEQQARFEAAERTYQTADTPQEFHLAAAQYQQLTEEGIESGMLFYRLGNAYLRAEQPARAVAAYRRAQRYLPRDPFVEANLRTARAAAGALAHPPDGRRNGWAAQLVFWQDWLSYPTKLRGSLLAALATFVLGGAWLVRRSAVWRRLSLVALSATVPITLAAIHDWYRFEYKSHGVLLRPAVVRQGDGQSYAAAVGAEMPAASEFVVLGRRGDWLQIELGGAASGWVEAEQVLLY